MEVRAEAVAGAAHIADHLSLRHRCALGDGVGRLARVAGREAAAEIDARVVPVAADPTGEDDGSGLGSVDRSAARDRNVDPGVQASPALTERADLRPAD